MRSTLTLSIAVVLALQSGLVAQQAAARQARSAAATRLTLGEFLIDPPTLINLGFEWFVDGDDNRNASIAVSYRRHGDTAWKEGPPLLRLQNERIRNGNQLDVIVPNMFAGSVLDLQPDTEYDVRLVASDPDGIVGVAQKTVSVRTRKEPQPARSGRTFHVYPPGFQGQKQEPAFEGLMCAYT